MVCGWSISELHACLLLRRQQLCLLQQAGCLQPNQLGQQEILHKAHPMQGQAAASSALASGQSAGSLHARHSIVLQAIERTCSR